MTWPPFITDQPPQKAGTYLASCLNGDGVRFVKTHFYSDVSGWLDPHWITVEGWLPQPPPLTLLGRPSR